MVVVLEVYRLNGKMKKSARFVLRTKSKPGSSPPSTCLKANVGHVLIHEAVSNVLFRLGRQFHALLSKKLMPYKYICNKWRVFLLFF